MKRLASSVALLSLLACNEDSPTTPLLDEQVSPWVQLSGVSSVAEPSAEILDVVFGPEEFTRGQGHSEMETREFAVEREHYEDFTLHLRNGSPLPPECESIEVIEGRSAKSSKSGKSSKSDKSSKSGKSAKSGKDAKSGKSKQSKSAKDACNAKLKETEDTRVRSVKVWVNGVEVLRPGDFDKKVTGYDVEIDPREGVNELRVQGGGKPGSFFSIWIAGVSEEPADTTRPEVPQERWAAQSDTLEFPIAHVDPGLQYYRTAVGIIFNDDATGLAVRAVLDLLQAEIIAGGEFAGYIVRIPDPGPDPEDLRRLLATARLQQGVRLAYPLARQMASILSAEGDNGIGIAGVMWQTDLTLFPLLPDRGSSAVEDWFRYMAGVVLPRLTERGIKVLSISIDATAYDFGELGLQPLRELHRRSRRRWPVHGRTPRMRTDLVGTEQMPAGGLVGVRR